MLQRTHKFFIPKGTIIKNYKEWQQLLVNLLDSLHINSSVTDDNVVLHVGVTVGKAEAGATVKPELM